MTARFFLPVVLVLAGCDLGPDYVRPALTMPAGFSQPVSAAAPIWPASDWWRGFGSATLDRLIAAAEAENFDLLAAIARVRQADAQVRISGAPLLPTLNGTGSAQWQHQSTRGLTGGAAGFSSKSSYETRDYGVGLSASYELDFWGKNAATLENARASARASRFDQQTVALTVITNVANTWFQALAYHDRLAVAENNLKVSEEVLSAIHGRVGAGIATALDESQQSALVAGVRATIPNLRSQMDQLVIALGILTGRPPEAVDAVPGSLADLRLPPVAPGLPSALLQRRPDVANAEFQLIAANANIKEARAAFFPDVQLTGSGGFQNTAVTLLFGPGATIGSLAANLTQTIFDNGLKQGQLEANRGRYDELLADYRKAVVQAFTDVETALAAFRYASEQTVLQQDAVTQAQRSVTIATAQLAAGTVDLTSVLQAQQTLFTDEDTLVQVQLLRAQSLLNLYKALGGGWSAPVGADSS